MALLHFTQPRRNVSPAVDGIELIGHQQARHTRLEQRQYFGIGQLKAPRLNHKQNQIHIGHGTQHSFIERLVQRRTVQRLKTRCIHKYKLGLTLRSNAGDTVTRRLRFT